MITSRHIQKVIWAAVLTAVLVLGILAAFSNQLSSGISLSYEQKLFDTDQVMTVNIRIDEDEWDDLLETAISETYYCCDIEINGETYYRVGIRAKGNTSLSMVASSDSDRYSFKVKFDEYVDGQTCYGLDKLVLNNNYSDATMMKEAVVYDMFAFLDVDASLYNYARISVNGEYWGVYLALEAVEKSFALRNYGTHYGNLYKPCLLYTSTGRRTICRRRWLAAGSTKSSICCLSAVCRDRKSTRLNSSHVKRSRLPSSA